MNETEDAGAAVEGETADGFTEDENETLEDAEKGGFPPSSRFAGGTDMTAAVKVKTRATPRQLNELAFN